MIELNDSLYIAKGGHRLCYIHPEDKNKVIKVIHKDLKPGKELQREVSYYNHLERRKIDWSMLSRYYGDKETNLGIGMIFDLVRDFDGNISKSLEYFLDSPKESAELAPLLEMAWLSFKAYILKNRILTLAIHAPNLLFQKLSTKEGRFVLIDNIGTSDFIPLCKYFRPFAEKKINRKWAKLERSILKHYPENKTFIDIIERNRA